MQFKLYIFHKALSMYIVKASSKKLEKKNKIHTEKLN